MTPSFLQSQTLTSIEGVEVGGGPTFIGGNVVAVATSWDGKYLAVGRYFAPSITVFDLASGSQLNEIGEEGSAVRFHDLIKLCFNRSGNIIGAEDTSKRLQEVTVTGEFVRYYGVGVIDGHMYGVAANDEYVVTGGVAHIFLFHAVSGDFVRVFGSCGSQLGGVNSCYGMRFSLDGSRVIVTDTHNNRLSVFLLDGTFVECLGVGQLKSPRDLDFADNGDILVCCRNGITVFSPNGSTVIRNFRPIAMDKDNRPRADGYGTGSAISVRDGKLYIVFQYSSRVAVYQ